jgi:hypothetical protein
LFGGYVFGNEILILNGTFTFLGLYLISKKGNPAEIQSLKV